MALPAKETLFQQIAQKLEAQNILVESSDMQRPWGGFFVISRKSLPVFISQYFQHSVQLQHGEPRPDISPKVLLVAPGAKLSWQYHHRRSEIWSVVNGPVGVSTSESDLPAPADIYSAGDRITIPRGTRHRLIGLDDWGVVAEIWIHTDPGFPSDENDIIRLKDDYGR